MELLFLRWQNRWLFLMRARANLGKSKMAVNVVNECNSNIYRKLCVTTALHAVNGCKQEGV